MISVSVDEAYAYDMLSILQVKNLRVLTEDGVRSFERLTNELSFQVGSSLHETILGSPQYETLLTINAALFDALEMIKRTDKHYDDLVEGESPHHTSITGEWLGAAYEIDRMVYKRYLGKRALQLTFFGDKPLMERKIGYTQ